MSKSTEIDGVFFKVAQDSISELKESEGEWTKKQWETILKLESLAMTDKKLFVKKYKQLSGATNFDLHDALFAYS